MITWIVGINCAIALVLILTAWRLWRLRQTLVAVSGRLAEMELGVQQALGGADSSLADGQYQLQQLGLRYRQSSQQLKQVKQVLLVLGWMQGYLNAPKNRNIKNQNTQNPSLEGQRPQEKKPRRENHEQ